MVGWVGDACLTGFLGGECLLPISGAFSVVVCVVGETCFTGFLGGEGLLPFPVVVCVVGDTCLSGFCVEGLLLSPGTLSVGCGAVVEDFVSVPGTLPVRGKRDSDCDSFVVLFIFRMINSKNLLINSKRKQIQYTEVAD